MSRCTEPGCRRRCLAPYTRCVNHRPPNPLRNQGNRKAHDETYRERARRLRAVLGLPSGWEGA